MTENLSPDWWHWAGETAKARSHRLRNGWYDKYILNKNGIDIGCGSDTISPMFQKYDKEEGDATFMTNIANFSYDTVYASHILEHLNEPLIALTNWWRILRHGGHLIVVVPHRDMYEKKKSLPSNWNLEHKSYWLPENDENEFTFGLKETIKKTIPDGTIVDFKILDEGFRSYSDDSHSFGEYSIEVVIKKPSLELLKVYNVNFPKVRLGQISDPSGSWADGGYVVSLPMILKSTCMFGYGVGTEISFEKNYIFLTGKKSYCFDHTVQIDDKSIVFLKQGLSAFKTPDTNNFLKHYKELDCEGKVLLKIDIEGNEYDYFLKTEMAEIAEITTGIVIEFHFLDDPHKRSQFFEIIKKINNHFLLCHIHGNNCSSTFIYENHDFPMSLELTFINKNLVEKYCVDKSSYPSQFDLPNVLSVPDLNLDFLNI